VISHLTDYKTREAWLASRSQAIGASEVAALFGLMPKSWGSVYTLWAGKVGLARPTEMEGEWLEWGQLLEDPIAKKYERVTGRTLWQGGGPFCVAQHPTLPMLRCTPDRFVVSAPDRDCTHPGILQVKNTAWFMGDNWREGPPAHVQIQLQSEMACTGAEWGSAAVLVGGNSYLHVDVERNPDLIAEIEAQVAYFWNTYVVTGVEPDIDGSEATTAFLKRLHPKDNGLTVKLGNEAMAIVAQWESAKAALSAAASAMKTTAEDKDEAANRLRAIIGDNTYGALPDGRVLSLRTTSRAGSVTEPTTYRSLKFEKPPKAVSPKKVRGAKTASRPQIEAATTPPHH
jgi:putative phage-type endonuclease